MSSHKLKKQYICQSCGSIQPKWLGQCPDCGEWNTLIEELAPAKMALAPRLSGYAGNTQVTIQALDCIDKMTLPRFSTGMGELDRVLGGGLVQGSVVLLGGDPGIGKSTILLQTMVYLAKHYKVLYVTGEESPAQVALRAERLQLHTDMQLLAETAVERILQQAEPLKIDIMVIDSIQTVFTEQLSSAPGNVGQVRESAALLTRFAKRHQTAIFLVGHVTKEGAIAGPRVLEHMVDTVLYFEGDGSSRYRIMRAYKNRFGPVNEIGVFAMTELGVKGITNPSAIFLSRHDTPVAGSVITVTREGTRPLLVEVQALVDQNYGNYARRITLGVEQNRLTMLLAVLNRHAQVAMHDQDVYVNAVGGVKINETASDLAVIAAAYSSFRNLALPHDLIIFGELGLAGEIRPVQNGDDRLKEAAKHGFKCALIPKANAPKKGIEGMRLLAVGTLYEAIEQIKQLAL